MSLLTDEEQAKEISLSNIINVDALIAMLNDGIRQICTHTYRGSCAPKTTDGIYALRGWKLDRDNLQYLGDVTIETREGRETWGTLVGPAVKTSACRHVERKLDPKSPHTLTPDQWVGRASSPGIRDERKAVFIAGPRVLMLTNVSRQITPCLPALDFVKEGHQVKVEYSVYDTVKNYATMKLVLDPPGTSSLTAQQLPTRVLFQVRHTIIVTQQSTGDKLENRHNFNLFLRLPTSTPYHPVARN